MEVFISFIYQETDVAQAVVALLKEKLPNNQVFLAGDPWLLYAGEIWLERIREELNLAKVVVSLFSKNSLSRPWTNFEAGAAWLKKTPIIPACFNGVTKGSLPHPYSSMQALDLRTDAYYLVTSVAHHLGELAPPPLSSDFGGLTGKYAGVVGKLHQALDKHEGKLTGAESTPTQASGPPQHGLVNPNT
jgi:hypothetical protein